MRARGRFSSVRLAIRAEALGPAHPDTAASLNNLAYLLWDLADLAGARLLFERALTIIERVLRAEHPNPTGRGAPCATMGSSSTSPGCGMWRWTRKLVATVAGGAQAKTAPGRT